MYAFLLVYMKFRNEVQPSSVCCETACCAEKISEKAHEVLDGTLAEAYVDTGVKILIAVVIGALLLAGLYTLFNSTIMPTVTQKITELFNYAG